MRARTGEEGADGRRGRGREKRARTGEEGADGRRGRDESRPYGFQTEQER